MPVVKENKNPFLDRESAIAALNEFMAGTTIDRGGMYLLNIINTLIQDGKEIFQRIPSEIFGGCAEGGRRNVQASALCRASNGAVPTAPDETLPSGYTRSQEIIGHWAERDGCWSNTPDGDQLKAGRRHNDLIDGSEARVYFDDPARLVYKTIDFSHYPSFACFLDRIAIHNAVFPETAMTVVGFGMREDAEDNSGFAVTVRQPFVIGDKPSDDEDMDLVQAKLEERGIYVPEHLAGWMYVSQSGNFLLADIHDNNCLFSKGGDLLVFDCEAYLNINPALGGKFTIPPLSYSESSVKEIVRTVRSLIPQSLPEESIYARLAASDAKRAREEIRTAGRTGEYVKTLSDGPLVLQVDPEKPGNLLISGPDDITRALSFGVCRMDDGTHLTQTEFQQACRGGCFIRNGAAYAFNLDKGRIDRMDIPQRKKRLSQAVERKISI